MITTASRKYAIGYRVLLTVRAFHPGLLYSLLPIVTGWCDYLTHFLDSKLVLTRHDLLRLADIYCDLTCYLFILINRLSQSAVSFLDLLLLLEA